MDEEQLKAAIKDVMMAHSPIWDNAVLRLWGEVTVIELSVRP